MEYMISVMILEGVKQTFKTLERGDQKTISLLHHSVIFCLFGFNPDMSLVAHRFGRVEFRIFVIVFFKQAQLKNQNKYSKFKSMSYQGH